MDARRSTPYAARRALLVATAAVALLVMGQPVPASATYPGGAGRIAFQGVDGVTGRLQLFTARADGTDQRQLTSFSQADIESPDWSPDGSTIVFNSADDQIQRADVFVIRPDGTGLRRLTHGHDVGSFPAVLVPDRDADRVHPRDVRTGRGWRVQVLHHATGRHPRRADPAPSGVREPGGLGSGTVPAT